MPIINIPQGGTFVTQDPNKYVPVSDTWSPASSGAGYTVLKTDNSTGNAISELVQGTLYATSSGLNINPANFGGIVFNNDADQYAQVSPGMYGVTTTMPNLQAPLVNYVYCNGVFIAEILHVIDDNTIVVKDPSGVVQSAGSGYTLTGFSANSYTIKNASVYINPSASCLLWTPGQYYVQLGPGTIEIEPNNYGECSPIMVESTSDITVLTYNE